MRLGMGLRLSDITILKKFVETGSTLLNDLVSYWALDEISGVRYDSVGENDLTDNNTVGSVVRGPEGTVASFVAANSEMLTKSPLLTFDQSAHTIAGWAKLNSMGNDIITYLTGNGGRCGVYAYTSGGKIALVRYVMYDGGYKVASVNVDIPFNAWFFFVADADGANARISVNNGTPGSAASGFAVPDTNYPTVLGALAASQNYLDGQLGEVGIWDRVLTSDERTSLFNRGNGKTYEDLAAAEKTGLVSYWKLDEVGGVRYDSHGSNDLTDNNTVGSAISGPKGVVASFVAANSEALERAAIPLDLSTGLTYALWTKRDLTTHATVVINGPPTWAGGTGLFGASTVGIGPEVVYWYVSNETESSANYLSLPDTGWHLLVMWYDPTDKKAYISLDNKTPVSGSALTTHPVINSAGYFKINTATTWASVPGDATQQVQGEIGLWNRALTADERTALFNSGNGKTYEDLTAAEKVGLVSYWRLDEASGTRYDSHGSNDLADVNTVGSVINAGVAMDGGAASFIAANSETLSSTTYPIGATGSWTYAGWAKFPVSTPAGFPAMYRSGEVVPPYRYTLLIGRGAFSNAINIYSGDAFTGDYMDPAAGPYNGAWIFVCAWYDEADGKVRLSLDNRTPVESARTSVPVPTYFDMGSSAQDFLLDEVGIWSRVLTDDERAELYAAGAGKFYPFEE